MAGLFSVLTTTTTVVLTLVAAQPASLQEERSSIVVNQLAILELMNQLRFSDSAAANEEKEKLSTMLSIVNDTQGELERLSGEHDSKTTTILQKLSEIKEEQNNQAISLQEHFTANDVRLEGMESALVKMEEKVEELQEDITAQQEAALLHADAARVTNVESAMLRMQGEIRQTKDLVTEIHQLTRARECPPEYFFLNNQCFFVNQEESMTWQTARLWCQRRGGDLAQPVHVEEFMTAVREIFSAAVWLGASDREKEGSWVWLSGEPIPESLAWNTHEPNNAGSGEDCLEGVAGTRQFNDRSCEVKFNFVCER